MRNWDLKIKAWVLQYWPVNLMKASIARLNNENQELQSTVKSQRDQMLEVLNEVQEWKRRRG
jgi:uncharacterized coiled-coil DUF342 family protein